jgi:hypothetical protein
MCRCVAEYPNSDFLNWKDERGIGGTASLTARTKKTCKKLRISLKMSEEKMVVKTEGPEINTNTTVSIGLFLTQKIVRANMYKSLIQHEVHGTSYTTLKVNKVSNSMITNGYTTR